MQVISFLFVFLEVLGFLIVFISRQVVDYVVEFAYDGHVRGWFDAVKTVCVVTN